MTSPTGETALRVPVAEPPERPAAESRQERPLGPKLEERAGVIEVDLPNGTRVRTDAFVNERGAAPRSDGVEERLVILNVAPGTKVYLACRPVDMRKGFDGLAAVVAATAAEAEHVATERLGGAPPNRSYASGEILWRSRLGASRGLPNLESPAT